MSKKVVIGLLALIMSLIFVESVFAKDNSGITTEFDSAGFGSVNIKLNNSFDFIETDSKLINWDLALIGAVLSEKVYDGEAGQLLNQMGYDRTLQKSMVNVFGGNGEILHPESTFAYKRYDAGDGKEKNIFVIVVQGTNGPTDVTTDILSWGISMFDSCRTNVINDFQDFAADVTGKTIAQLKKEENYFFITGHSLGGATANCLSVDQTIMEMVGNDKGRIYTYTYESPHTCVNLWWMEPAKMSNAFNLKDHDDWVTYQPPYIGSTTYGNDMIFGVQQLDDSIFKTLFPDAKGGSVLEAPKKENHGDVWGHHDIGLDLTYVIQQGLQKKWWNDVTDAVPSESEAAVTQIIMSEERIKTDEDGYYLTYSVTFWGLDDQFNHVWEYVSDNNPCTELDSAAPIDIRNGTAYLVDCGNVVALDANTGEFLWRTQESFPGPAFNFDKEGNLYICGYYGDGIYKYDKYGRLIYKAPLGELFWPHDIIVDDSTLLVPCMQGFEIPTIAEYNITDGRLISTNFDDRSLDVISRNYVENFNQNKNE